MTELECFKTRHISGIFECHHFSKLFDCKKSIYLYSYLSTSLYVCISVSLYLCISVSLYPLLFLIGLNALINVELENKMKIF